MINLKVKKTGNIYSFTIDFCVTIQKTWLNIAVVFEEKGILFI